MATFSSVLNQLGARGTAYDAAKCLSQKGYVKRVSPPTLQPSITKAAYDALPAATQAFYESDGNNPPVTYTLKSSVSFTYALPQGSDNGIYTKLFKEENSTMVMEDGASSVTASINTGAAYPYLLVFVSGDGTEFLLNMSAEAEAPASGTADGGDAINETSVPAVPFDRSILLYVATGDWALGTAAEFENARSGGAIW